MRKVLEKYERYSIEATNKRRELSRIRVAQWRKENPAKFRAQHRAYYRKNREKILAFNSAWRERNKGKVRHLRTLNYLKHKHGISPERYEELFALQNGCCAICDSVAAGSKDKFHVDHDHKTGAIRGVLCPRCNHGLGHFKDDPKLLIRAVAYLKRSDSDC